MQIQHPTPSFLGCLGASKARHSIISHIFRALKSNLKTMASAVYQPAEGPEKGKAKTIIIRKFYGITDVF